MFLCALRPPGLSVPMSKHTSGNAHPTAFLCTAKSGAELCSRTPVPQNHCPMSLESCSPKSNFPLQSMLPGPLFLTSFLCIPVNSDLQKRYKGLNPHGGERKGRRRGREGQGDRDKRERGTAPVPTLHLLYFTPSFQHPYNRRDPALA